MIDLIALVLAVLLLLQLTRVRAFLSFVFDPMRMRRIGAPRIPEAFADLHTGSTGELRALGFEGPVWFLLDSPDGGVVAQPVAAWFQREHGDVVWLYAPSPPGFANRLVTVFVRRLADGRHCVSQAFDCYAEILANPQVLAQTIGGADLAAQWQSHRDFCARYGEAAADATDTAELDFQASELWQQRIASLVERRKVYRDTKGLLRPTLAFAWQMFRAFQRQPKPPAATQPIPPARLAWLAQVAQRQTQRPVPRRVQSGLFMFSVALFLLIGGWFWGVRFAAVLLVVVGIHEFGHYMAMRLSGYRNVQMLALPLVGGVTIGHEAKPDAARRAWMSLMGPLPGIVIGWALLLMSLFGGVTLDGLVLEAAIVFLFVNYLNVLPVPPLDGAHVVQELLPVGSARLSAVFIAVASVGGALVAFSLGFKLLVFVALLQLPLVRTRWQLGGVLRILRGDPQMQASQPAMLRQRRVFEVFDRVAGATAQVPARLALGAEAMRSIDVKPMRPLQRLCIGATYAALLAGPLLAGIVAIEFGSLLSFGLDASEDAEKYRQRTAQFEAQAAKLSVAELLRGIAELEATLGDESRPALANPADAAAIAAAQARLGATLPEDLLAVYRVSDGSAAIGLLPLDRIRRVDQATELDLAKFTYEGHISVFALDVPATSDAAPRELTLTPQQMQSFLVLEHDTELGTVALYDLGEPPQHAGLRLYSLDLEGGAYASPDLHAWMRSRWVQSAQMKDMGERLERARERERAAIADWPALRLLDEIDQPGFLQRRLAPQVAWSGPASDADVASVAVRFGAALPGDLAEIHRRHDGIPALALLPLVRWQRVSQLPDRVSAPLRKRVEASELGIDTAALDQCVVFSGYYFEPDADVVELAEEIPAGLQGASALWCPQAAADRRILDLQKAAFRPSYTEILRDRVAQQRASQAAME